MAILALLLESGRPGLLLPLLSQELRGPSCVQQLVLLAGEAWGCPRVSSDLSPSQSSSLSLQMTYLDCISVPPLLTMTILKSVGLTRLCTGALCMGTWNAILECKGSKGMACAAVSCKNCCHMNAEPSAQLSFQALCWMCC